METDKRRRTDEKEDEQPEYFDFDRCPSGGHGENQYVRLKNPDPKYYGDAIMQGSAIEVLWQSITTHRHMRHNPRKSLLLPR